MSKAEAKYGVTVANYELFEESGTLSDWVSKVLALWKSIDVDFDLVQQAPGGYVYEVGDPGGQRELIVLVLSNGQPLGLTLEGRGTFQDPATFVEALLPDLLTMTRSLSAPTQTRSGGTTERSTPLAQKSLGLAPLDMGPYFGDSGYRTSDAYTYRLQDDYYEAPPRSYWLYEYMYYENYAWHQTILSDGYHHVPAAILQIWWKLRHLSAQHRQVCLNIDWDRDRLVLSKCHRQPTVGCRPYHGLW